MTVFLRSQAKFWRLMRSFSGFECWVVQTFDRTTEGWALVSASAGFGAGHRYAAGALSLLYPLHTLKIVVSRHELRLIWVRQFAFP